ncbi:EutN/CcmL family microcompartment protein [Halobacillus yeomjeoni]|uniref:EutN/CcmL family microcompartment protein n=1 Tax=Halobacillus yeomjeoni TaxID=311194 RepID=A0A931HTW5_9BACI|nr:EutN/CcmL family microcompartment protein [Halobacillus yeomjeoni]MBH0229712.1 EutN/CcmL family microcompartment protein [Halobacillus yeomjeoni]
MIVGEVVGNIWATRKEDNLTGFKFLVVEPDTTPAQIESSTFVAVDRIGAGVGDKVMVTRGSASAQIDDHELIPIDALIIGIIDSVEVERGGSNV